MSQKRHSFETIATLGLIAATALLSVAILVAPKAGSGGGHGHGHGGGGEEEEHGAEEQAIELDDEQLESAAMTIEEVKAMSLTPKVRSRGQLTENPNLAMNIKPWFGGIARSVPVDFGTRVRKGDALLTIESASTRASYTIRSTVSGIVADKQVVAGSYVPEGESIMRVIDLSSVWFQGDVPIFEAMQLKTGQKAVVYDRIQDIKAEGRVIHASPVVQEDTQTTSVRIELDNRDSTWNVGSFADAEVFLPERQVAHAIRSSAIQTLNGQTVIFRRSEDKLIAQKVRTGWSDGTWTEILEGVSVGDAYLATNSFLAKAEYLKSTAEHAH